MRKIKEDHERFRFTFRFALESIHAHYRPGR
jgi:hypothetical protein